MLTLGDLELRVMDVLWASGEPVAASVVRDRLTADTSDKPLASTTVLTVLSRLEAKGLVTRDRDVWPHRYGATTARADHMAKLMHDVLDHAVNRDAVLARFVGRVSPDEIAQLRQLLESV